LFLALGIDDFMTGSLLAPFCRSARKILRLQDYGGSTSIQEDRVFYLNGFEMLRK
jgi:hypothetical protein